MPDDRLNQLRTGYAADDYFGDEPPRASGRRGRAGGFTTRSPASGHYSPPGGATVRTADHSIWRADGRRGPAPVSG